MPLFCRRKDHEVQGFMVKLINNNCPELEALIEGPRLEGRVRLCLVVLVVPVTKGKPKLAQLFPAVTKEFSTMGVSQVVSDPRAVEDVILAFRRASAGLIPARTFASISCSRW